MAKTHHKSLWVPSVGLLTFCFFPTTISLKMPKTRSTAAKIALPLFFVAVVCISVAFSTTHWLENWSKYYGDKFDKLGLWVHCFRSLPDPHDALHLRYFTGCRWVFNPFTAGYAEMRDFLMPRKIILVELITMCFFHVWQNNTNCCICNFSSILHYRPVVLHIMFHADAGGYSRNSDVCIVFHIWTSSTALACPWLGSNYCR